MGLLPPTSRSFFVDYVRRRPRESLLAVLKRPVLISFVSLSFFGTVVMMAIMDSSLWDAAFWEKITPVPFFKYFAFSMAGALLSTVRDIATRDRRAVTVFEAFQNSSRLTNFFVLTGLASAFISWVITR